jgi:amino acid adenylation domain-containing protein
MQTYKPAVSQQLIWLDQALSDGSAKYNIGGYAWLKGQLVYDAFQESIRKVLQSQEAYSTVFRNIDGELTCLVGDAAKDYSMEVIDLSTERDAEAAALQWMQNEFASTFPMVDSYLFCFKLLKIQDGLHFWYAKIHHLIGDGWSFKLLLNQAAEFYSVIRRGEVVDVPRYRYSDYSVEDESYYGSSAAADDRAFWMEEYRQLPATLFTRSARMASQEEAGSETLNVPVELKQRLQQVAEEHKVSLFHLIVGLLVIYFGRVCQQETVTIGVPVLNRTKKVYRNTAGVFMNLLSLKFGFSDSDTLGSLMNAIKQKMSASLRHQRYQYGNLVKDLHLPNERRLLYDIRISYEDFDFTGDFGGLQAGAIALSNHSEVDPLAIYVREYSGEGFDVRFIYNIEYFSKERMGSVAKSLHHMMCSVAAGSDCSVAEMRLLDPREKAAVLELSHGVDRPFMGSLIPDGWRRSVSRCPGNIAVSCGDSEFTYAEMNERVLRLAGGLSDAMSNEPKPLVALLLPRSEVMVAAMLASMMAGLTYIPIDPDLPRARIQYILQDAQCTLVLTSEALLTHLPEDFQGRVLDAGGFAEFGSLPAAKMGLDVSGDQPCYILYTSGSTGQPKGVLIRHRSVADYSTTFREYFGITEKDVVLQHASIGFDTSVEEIFPVLEAGGRLHILEDRRNLPDLVQTLDKEKVTVLSTNPWVLQFLDTVTPPAALRTVISGGDTLMYTHVRNIVSGGRIAVFNSYGPTESTVCATYCAVTGQEEIPIGRPIANRQVYILDTQRHLQPFGTEGDIYIGGEGLAIGYLDRKMLDQERFLPSPFTPGERIYFTGDRGILMPDGNIFFKGRKDEQVNYRGYRIETAEIEAVINQQENVVASVVDVKQVEGLPVLVAYIRYDGARRWSMKEWRRLMASRLPAFMIPDCVIELREFPLLSGGKVNRKELPVITAADLKPDKTVSRQPETAIEIKIQGAWAKILKLEAIGVDDSFFSLGGHSLNVVQLIAGLKEQFGNIPIGIQHIFTHDTIRMQAVVIASMTGESLPAGPVQHREDYPLTPAQEHIWLLSQLDSADIAYHISGALLLKNEVDGNAVERAVNALIDRHEALRTVFIENESGMVRQRVLPRRNEGWKVHAALPLIGGKQEDVMEVCRSVIHRPFDLTTGPLVRTALIQLAGSEFLLLYVTHHIISDGWSMEILLKEFLELYEAREKDMATVLPVLNKQFKDVLPSGAGTDPVEAISNEQFWVNKLKGRHLSVDLPAQYARPPVKTYTGREVSRWFTKEQLERLVHFCEQEKVTVFTALFATLNALIYRYTGQTGTTVGTPVVNREDTDTQQQVGLFLDVIPVRTQFSEDISFRELLQVQRTELLQAYQFSRYPMDRLAHKLGLRNDASRSPLFDILIVLHNQQLLGPLGTAADAATPTGLRVEQYDRLPRETSQFDMSFAFFYEGSRLKLRLNYNNALFDEWFARQTADHFVNLALAAVGASDKPVSQLDYLSAEELERFSDHHYQEYKTDDHRLHITDYLMSSVHRSPGNVAVVKGDIRLDYAALVRSIENIWLYLTVEKGVKEGDHIGVMLTPDEYFPACLFAIWMTGSVFVPIHPAYPEIRRNSIIEDAQCAVVLTASDVRMAAGYQGDRRRMQWVTFPVAYILYTSGTTGTPKGVVVSHKALLEKLQVEKRIISVEGAIHSFLITNFAFDVSFLELLLPVLTGGKIVIPESTVLLELDHLDKILVQERVNVLHGTPAFMETFFRHLPERAFAALNNTLEVICLGGESLYERMVDLLRQKLPAVRLNNHYGPTEAVIHASAYENIQSFSKNIIGRALPGVRTYVLDRHLQVLPAGVTGELFIGGSNALANGYWKRPEETTAKFITNPFVGGERLYRTGDQVKWTGNGLLEFIGRMDHQVKIRGLRIELDEIQRALEQHAMVEQAAVIACKRAENTILIAFVVSPVARDVHDWKGYLRKYLPEYMIPAMIIPMPTMPLNENGKIDKEKLMAAIDWTENKTEVIPPSGETERKLVRVWEHLLERSPIGIRDNFLDLGGNSILLVRMRAEIRTKMGVTLALKDLLNLMTIEHLAQAIDALEWLRQDTPAEETQNMNEFTV